MRRYLGLIILVILTGRALADVSPATTSDKASYLRAAQAQLEYWRDRADEVLTKRDTFPDGSSQYDSLDHVLGALRDKENDAADELDNFRSSGGTDWQATKNKIDHVIGDMVQIYGKSLAY